MKKKLYAQQTSRHESITEKKKPAQFKINTWWKKALAIVGIAALTILGAASFLGMLPTVLELITLVDPGASLVSLLILGGLIYSCYRGIKRLVRDWGNKR